MNFDWLSITKLKDKKLGTLPVGYRPAYSILGMAYHRGGNSCGQVVVNTDGTVVCYSQADSNCYFAGSVAYPVKVS